MTPEDWREVDATVAGALDLPTAQREELLRKNLNGREDLMDEARSLLSYDQDGQSDPFEMAQNEGFHGSSDCLPR